MRQLEALVAEAEAARVLQICNACRYCEGFCAVFPAMTRRLEFPPADVQYLANLCHSCGACLHACQYAPPHEFAVNVPRSLARVRARSWQQHAWPAAFGQLYQRNGVVVAVVLLPPAPVVAVTVHSSDGRTIASSSTQADGLELDRDPAGRGTATIDFPKIPLLKGEYFIGVYLLSEDGIHVYDGAANVATLHFSQKTLEQGVVSLPRTWHSAAGAATPGECVGAVEA